MELGDPGRWETITSSLGTASLYMPNVIDIASTPALFRTSGILALESALAVLGLSA